MTNNKTIPFLDKFSERTDVLYESAKVIKTKVTLDKYSSYSKIHFPLHKEIKCSLKIWWASHVRIRWGWQMDECIRKFPQSLHARKVMSDFIPQSNTESHLRETGNDWGMRQEKLLRVHNWDLSVHNTEWQLSDFPLFQRVSGTEIMGFLLSAGIGTNCERWIPYLLPSLLSFAYLSHLLCTA